MYKRQEKANGIYALKKANEMVKGIVTDGVYNMNDIYQEGTFMVLSLIHISNGVAAAAKAVRQSSCRSRWKKIC